MLVSDIITAVGALTNYTNSNNATWIAWINACLDDLSTVAYIPSRFSVSLTAGTTEYTVPTGVQDITGFTLKPASGSQSPIRQLHPLDFYNAGVKLLDKIVLQNLTFATGDTLVINGYGTFTHVAATTDTPGLEPQYHEMIVLFCSSRAMQEEEEAEIHVDFYKEYMNRKQQYEAIKLHQAEPWSVKGR